jgi:dipeptidyl aminopeptidase/acylaminoacyl peptidase
MKPMSATHSIPLIPRARLFGNPERGPCQISPDGRWLAFSAPRDGVLNLWVCPRADLAAARPVTNDRAHGVRAFKWAHDGVHLLYQQDVGGDENFHLFAVRAADGEVRDLTPFEGVRGLLQMLSRKHRGEVLINMNRRDPRFADLWRLSLGTGEMSLVQQNSGLAGFIADDDFRVRLAMAPQPDGGWVWLKPAAQGALEPWQSVPAADAMTSNPLHVSADGSTLYALDSRGRDTAALVAFDLDNESAAARVIAENARADVVGVLTDLQTHAPLACAVNFERREFHVLDESIRADVEALNNHALGEWSVASRTEDDRVWIVRSTSDINPACYHLYERDTQRLTFLYDCLPALAGLPLARMQSTTLKSRDGLDMVSYLTLPVGAPGSAAWPLVLLVHGGPWARDDFGFNPEHQWLANRGYAVLSVNFRSSTGFGKAFVNAGDLQWGAKMDDDLCDAVDWAVAQGHADPARVAIMGASYGGYATLWALAAHPERYACGVDIVGPSNLETLLEAIPPQWEAARETLYRQVGDPRTPDGLALLTERSPLHRAAHIRKPLLIGQGANDPRVKQVEADQMVAAMKANGIAVTYVLYPDEFLARHLGGRSEPGSAAEIEGNTAVIDESAAH